MILKRQGRISRSCGKARMLIWARSERPWKDVLMNDDRKWFWDSRIRNRDNGLIQYWLLRCLALPIVAALWCVPATAQCTAYVPTHKSNSVAVIDTVLDRVAAVVPVQFQPLAVAITPNGAFAYVTNSGWPVGSNSVSVIDTAKNTLVDTVQGVAVAPEGVAIMHSRNALTFNCR